MTTNKQLRELAEGAAHWSGSLAHVWPSDPDFNDAWTVGTIDEDGNKYPVIEVDADQYDAPGDSERLARFFTAANPAAVLSLLDTIEILQAECDALREALLEAQATMTSALSFEPVINEVTKKTLGTGVEIIKSLLSEGGNKS